MLPVAPEKGVGVICFSDAAMGLFLSTPVIEAAELPPREMVWTSERVVVSTEASVPEPEDETAQPWHFCPALSPGTAILTTAGLQPSHICAAMVGSASGTLAWDVYCRD